MMDLETKVRVANELGFDPETAGWRDIERGLANRVGQRQAKCLIAKMKELGRRERATISPAVDRLRALAERF